MLTIRKQQMEAFRLASISRFENWLAKHIATLYPQQSELLGELGVRKFIRKAIETGSKYGVDTEGAVTTLIELMLAYGEQFETSPDQSWALEILAHPTLPGDLKVDVIRDRFSEFRGNRGLSCFSSGSFWGRPIRPTLLRLRIFLGRAFRTTLSGPQWCNSNSSAHMYCIQDQRKWPEATLSASDFTVVSSKVTISPRDQADTQVDLTLVDSPGTFTFKKTSQADAPNPCDPTEGFYG